MWQLRFWRDISAAKASPEEARGLNSTQGSPTQSTSAWRMSPHNTWLWKLAGVPSTGLCCKTRHPLKKLMHKLYSQALTLGCRAWMETQSRLESYRDRKGCVALGRGLYTDDIFSGSRTPLHVASPSQLPRTLPCPAHTLQRSYGAAASLGPYYSHLLEGSWGSLSRFRGCQRCTGRE